MLLVLAVVCIALIILACVISCVAINLDFIAGLPAFVGVVGLIIVLIAIVWTCIDVSHLSVIDDKIAMYEEENAKIEEQIATIVEQYQKYETDIFTELAPESAITLVSLYPELKSDELVTKQIEVYLANNKTIKSLKEQQISGNVLRWWLYFGG